MCPVRSVTYVSGRSPVRPGQIGNKRTLYGAFAVKDSISSFWFLKRLLAAGPPTGAGQGLGAHLWPAAELGQGGSEQVHVLAC